MTLLVSWIAVDTHGPTSAYMVSDSRISWNNNQKFDYAKKVFASRKYPEIFGYAGDVLFPSIVLSQIVEMIDMNLLFDDKMTSSEKNKVVYEKLQYSFSKYPDVYGDNPIQILHISRDTTFDNYPKFYQYLMKWNKRDGWSKNEIKIPSESGILQVLGSGGNKFRQNYIDRYQQSVNKSTSRNVFHSFIDTLNNIKDKNCGGAPQLVGIYRKPFTNGNIFGILFNEKRFFLGMEVPKHSYYDKIEWRNENFELCSGETKKRYPEASIQKDMLRRK